MKKRVRTTAGGASGSVRNLRIREDTAKYLLNLDPNSAYYDPKSRSMREDPNPHKPSNEKTFSGDNFIKTSGDYEGWHSLKLHALQAQQRGLDVNMQVIIYHITFIPIKLIIWNDIECTISSGIIA